MKTIFTLRLRCYATTAFPGRLAERKSNTKTGHELILHVTYYLKRLIELRYPKLSRSFKLFYLSDRGIQRLRCYCLRHEKQHGAGGVHPIEGGKFSNLQNVACFYAMMMSMRPSSRETSPESFVSRGSSRAARRGACEPAEGGRRKRSCGGFAQVPFDPAGWDRGPSESVLIFHGDTHRASCIRTERCPCPPEGVRTRRLKSRITSD